MQTRAELFGPYIAAAKMQSYEYFATLCKLCKLCILPLDLVHEIGGRILALNILAAECEFNIDMVAKFMAAFDVYSFLSIGTYDSDMAKIIKDGAPYNIMATEIPGGYKDIYVLRSMIDDCKYNVVNILRMAAGNFKSITTERNCLAIDL